MNASTFKNWMSRADTLRGVSLEPDDSEFWAGYMLGLRSLYHGEKFGTEAEHELWFGIDTDEPDMSRRSRGEGYRAGFAGVDPVELFRIINGEYLTCQQLAEKSGVGDSRIRQIASKIPGGRKTDSGWKFPKSAVEYVASSPGRGRPRKKNET
jgi:hypothetical protein